MARSHPGVKGTSVKHAPSLTKFKFLAKMDKMQAAASPCPPVRSPRKQTDKQRSLQSLLRMHEIGIFTKDEVRQMVLTQMQMSPIAVKVSIDSKPEPAHSSSPTVQRLNKKLIVQRLEKKPTVQQRLHKKSRKSTDSKVTDLRKIVKNTTRQRFFNECLKERSSLWHLTPGGKQAMNRLLFERAVKEVLDKLYEENPGPLRAVKSQELKQCVHWQVMRDRNNWMGKEPKRASFYGTMSMFDFEGEKELIDKALSTAEDLTKDAVVVKDIVVVKTEDVVVVKTEDKCNVRAAGDKCNAQAAKDYCGARAAKDDCDARAVVTPTTFKHCHTCGGLVWIGKVEDCPPSAEIAFPLGSSWGTYSVDPYCKKCWGDESTLLQNLGGQHRAVGKKRKNTDVITEPADLIHKVVSKANDDAILRATRLHATTPPPRKKKTSQKKKIAKKSSKKKKCVYKTPKKKKRLGGWRGPLPRNAKKENVQRWQVCTVVHNVHNVFLSKSPN